MPVVDSVHADLEAKDLVPRIHLADTGYIDAEQLVRSRRTYDVDLVGPTAKDYHWQAREKTGFQASNFSIDWEHRRATCPAGRESITWSPGTKKGKSVIQVHFSMKDCSACAHKSKCTRARRRTLTLRPRDEHVALTDARKREKTDAYATEYALRAGVEGTISTATGTMGLRRSRYVGLAKTHLQHVGTAAALTLVRLADWFAGETPARTRQGAFERLMAAPAAA